jgi:hypothetical protein
MTDIFERGATVKRSLYTPDAEVHVIIDDIDITEYIDSQLKPLQVQIADYKKEVNFLAKTISGYNGQFKSLQDHIEQLENSYPHKDRREQQYPLIGLEDRRRPCNCKD